ncbi:MAG: DUF362 domain-containing protein [Clostridia bacterium]|nr:DUF362 domain-containing protein [Clostridia bacterium]
MEKSKVYFIDLRTTPNLNILQKLNKLIRKAGIDRVDFKNKFTALKIHFGEPGNVAYIRPNYVKTIADTVKELGGLPFLTDTNTLYMGKRSNAVQHLYAASENGFNMLSTGVNVIIADGLKGSDYKEIPVNGKHVKAAKIGTVIADSDIIISINHFKGHEMTGFGGALKNLGMGCGSRGGKLEMHSASKPQISKDLCTQCGLCKKNCAHDAIFFDSDKKAKIDDAKCTGCGQCIAMCMYGAATLKWDEDFSVITEKIAEYTLAVLKDRPGFHVNFMMDISPNCDCWSNNDMSIVPNLGIAASFDPVALDKACIDMVNAAPLLKGCMLDDGKDHSHGEGSDKFRKIYPRANWLAGLKHAESLGLGTTEYELEKIT